MAGRLSQADRAIVETAFPQLLDKLAAGDVSTLETAKVRFSKKLPPRDPPDTPIAQYECGCLAFGGEYCEQHGRPVRQSQMIPHVEELNEPGNLGCICQACIRKREPGRLAILPEPQIPKQEDDGNR